MPEQKLPMVFIVFKSRGQTVRVVPDVETRLAGENRVTVKNLLDQDVEVSHGGKLIAPNPFVVPAMMSGNPPSEVTYRVQAAADVPGSVFHLTFDALTVGGPSMRVTTFAAGDPEIIIT